MGIFKQYSWKVCHHFSKTSICASLFIEAVRETAEDFKKALRNKYDVGFFPSSFTQKKSLIASIFACFSMFLFIAMCRVDVDAKEENKSEPDEKFWEVLMSAEKKDYESICVQYGVTDFRGMLKNLNEKKMEREKEQEKVFLFISILNRNKQN